MEVNPRILAAMTSKCTTRYIDIVVCPQAKSKKSSGDARTIPLNAFSEGCGPCQQSRVLAVSSVVSRERGQASRGGGSDGGDGGGGGDGWEQ